MILALIFCDHEWEIFIPHESSIGEWHSYFVTNIAGKGFREVKGPFSNTAIVRQCCLHINRAVFLYSPTKVELV